MKKNTSSGFTLAEVLITLGIIGIVAAITIPTLIANTQGAKYRNQFKKAISTLSQAARMSDTQYGFDYAGVYQRCTNPKTDHPDNIRSICALVNGTIKGITYSRLGDLKINGTTKKYQITTISRVGQDYKNDNLHTYTLPDGTLILLHANLGTNTTCSKDVGTILKDDYSANLDGLSGCTMLIDINGTTLPNSEISCTTGSNTIKDNETCIVKNKDITDIFPVRVHDGIVEPATPAARYVLQSAK
ncbi:MAG: type II secretion system GspH family protein [Candidatus Gastranaerophilales bacterium]|nr:type II secretion system GspH family protein [Candidatus Gastranaerophilales bacterium]